MSPTTPPTGLVFTDTYYDTPAFRLREAHTYVRRRSGAWQLKKRHAGDLVGTACVEVCGAVEVERVLQDAGLAGLGELGPVARIGTTRWGWRVGRFGVVVDRATLFVEGCEIPHQVGEVEVVEEVGEGDVEAAVERLTKVLDGFVEEYGDVFRGGCGELGEQVPEGKLAAYFRWERVVREMRARPERKWSDEERRFLPLASRGSGRFTSQDGGI